MKILLIKLGALGDVLRTTPLLTALKKKFPSSTITWIVDTAHADILEGNPLIDQLRSFDSTTCSTLQKEVYDWAINLDKEKEALDCLEAAQAPKKSGFGRDAHGQLAATDSLSAYAYRLGIDDELKFRLNQKTYQQISFEQVGLLFQKEDYLFSLDSKSRLESDRHLKSLGADPENRGRLWVGLNTGSGARFAGKKLPINTYAELARLFHRQLNATVLLLGGKDEIERNQKIQALAPEAVLNTGSHSIRHFAAMVSRCDLVVSGDTTAMHIAIAMKVPVVAYFASTCASEIELYGRGAKVVSGISCAPCYKKICPIDEQCMKEMTAEEIFVAAQKYLQEKQAL